MTDNKLNKRLDQIQQQIDQLSETLINMQKEKGNQLTKTVNDVVLNSVKSISEVKQVDVEDVNFKRVKRMEHMHINESMNALMDDLSIITELEARSGSVTYLGVFAFGERQANWMKKDINTDDLLSLVDNRQASAILQSIGNADRLDILITLLRKPMSVNQLVESCHFRSTGQVYHHLKPLIAADIIEEQDNQRGIYHVKYPRIQGVIMLLAGISDLCIQNMI